MFGSVERLTRGRRAGLPGDDLVPRADVVMDRAFDLPAAPEVVWPWFVQLGKKRAGWYLPRSVERFVPPSRRALRHASSPSLQVLRVGLGDPRLGRPARDLRGGDPGAAARARAHHAARSHLRLLGDRAHAVRRRGTSATHVQLRLRLSPVKRKRLAGSVGELLDASTIAGLAAGLRERLG